MSKGKIKKNGGGFSKQPEPTQLSALTEEQTLRLLEEVLKQSGPLEESELEAAVAEMEDLHMSALMFQAWATGRTRAGWNASTQELTWFAMG